ncbi:MAG: hypothetical protein O2819_08645 [Planctomycetota bacterium]|nr:hypothetical protein [Planctomycetota bacterium]
MNQSSAFVLVAAMSALVAPVARAGDGISISFSGAVCTTNLTNIPWVFVNPLGIQTYMWGRLSTWHGEGTATFGSPTLAALDHTLLSYDLGNLVLDQWQSPAPQAPGFEVYQPEGSSIFHIRHNGEQTITLEINSLRTDVDDLYDISATGTGKVTLVAGLGAIGTPLFWEIMEATHGRGVGEYEIVSFNAVSMDEFKGNFNSVGTLRFEAPAVLEDLNDDGSVNGGDLALMLSAWGNCNFCPADINQDGAVDGADLTMLLTAWG